MDQEEKRQKKRAYDAQRRTLPEIQKKHRVANARYRATPEQQARKKAYQSRPEVARARREYRRRYHHEQMLENPSYRIEGALRGRLQMAVKNNYKSGSAVRDLGCSLDYLRQCLESKFLPPGIYEGVERPAMSWENYGYRGWHIDHIRPLASFDLTDRQQFLQAVHYTNLQPLWAEQNLKKSDNTDRRNLKPEQE